ncbi:MAG: TetR/AcrR family transcriptional regulator [Candidatus Pelagadaptatus aseana]|uniref:TetR/AcrR family transcriptional regulator n=1 Tax=Candidatus Pelagadaptatus aseana TaxID=3120508 RepID=UPI0039B25C37
MKTQTNPSARDRILTTAHDLFYQQGIRATGIDKIIAQSQVAKVTFYRHFPSKNDLVLTFLEYRHQLWIGWFKQALERHGNTIQALVPTLSEWFNSKEYRGCAFLNSVGELADELAEVKQITRNHKQDMMDAVSDLLPSSADNDEFLNVLHIAIEGAIIRAQYDSSPSQALKGLNSLIDTGFK